MQKVQKFSVLERNSLSFCRTHTWTRLLTGKPFCVPFETKCYFLNLTLSMLCPRLTSHDQPLRKPIHGMVFVLEVNQTSQLFWLWAYSQESKPCGSMVNALELLLAMQTGRLTRQPRSFCAEMCCKGGGDQNVRNKWQAEIKTSWGWKQVGAVLIAEFSNGVSSISKCCSFQGRETLQELGHQAEMLCVFLYNIKVVDAPESGLLKAHYMTLVYTFSVV